MKRLAIALLLGGLTLLPPTLPAKDKTPPSKLKVSPGDGHEDPYVRGSETEAWLVKEVRHRLLMLPWFGVFDDLGFTVQGDTVTLVGQVTQPILKDDAEKTVKKIEGVGKVVNNVEVLPLSPFDDQIRHRVYRAIYGDPMLGMRYGYRAMPSIHIIVKNGHVRLEGYVANESDRALAGMRAAGVPGTFEVINSLKVDEK